MSRLPVPTDLSREFWAAAAEHRLVVPCCASCGSRFFPPERLCPSCASADWEYAASAGAGTVAGFTVVHRAPSPDFETPYVLAVVDLDDGASMLTNLVDTDPESVSVGMPVRVAFADQPHAGALPVFVAGPHERLDVADTPQAKE
jgi:uncharacterized OB-fold protein